MRHIDLFSGIGGFSIASDRVWGKGNVKHIFCDNNKYCQEVIKKNFGKESVIYSDIRQLVADTERGGSHPAENQQELEGKGSDELCTKQPRDLGKIDLLTGGFPCQPFSQAGRRKGTGDDRYLWPQMLRVIQNTKPTWVLAENVRGLLTLQQGVVFEQVCTDLEGEGYEVQSFIIPAVGLNAPHRRDRIWILGRRSIGSSSEIGNNPSNAPNSGLRSGNPITIENGYATGSEQNRELPGKPKGPSFNASDSQSGKSGEQAEQEGRKDISGGDQQGNASNPQSIGDGGCPSEECSVRERELLAGESAGSEIWSEGEGCADIGSDTGNKGLEGGIDEGQGYSGQSGGSWCDERPNWNEDWVKVASEFCRVDDGLSNKLDGSIETESGFKLTRAGHRVERLKSLGNAIVPPIAEEIMKGIKYAEDQNEQGKI